MEKVSTASRAFKCQMNETVTLTFTPHNTGMMITYTVDDDAAKTVQGNSLSFTSSRDLMILRVFFHFNGDGGSYDVTLSGSAGGNFGDPPPVMQSHDIVPTRRYAFTH
jgi:hypothetical protein